MTEGVRAVIALVVGFVIYRVVITGGDDAGALLVALLLGLAAAFGTWALTGRWAKKKP